MNNSQPHTLHSAISLSNHGASLIEAGDSKNALSTLKLALQASRHVLRLQQQEGNSHEDVEGSCDFGTRHLDGFMKKVSHCNDFIDAPSCGGNAFVYGHAISVSTTSIPLLSGPEANTIISVIIVFNLALAHHRAGIDNTTANTDEEKRILLTRAGKLYESLFPLLQRSECEHGSVMFTLVALNNLGQVLRSLNEVEKATKCFHHLLSSMMYVIACNGSSSSSSEAIDIQTLEIFFGTTSHLIFPNCSGHASAA